MLPSMGALIHLGELNERRTFHGSRSSGQRLRFDIEEALSSHAHLTLDFDRVGVVTQSFIDEAIGVLILEFSPSILKRLSFKNCNEDVKAVLHYVAGTRSEDYSKQQPTAIH